MEINGKKVELTPELVRKIIGDRKECVLEPGYKCEACGECLRCDLDRNKFCDNCGKCLDTVNTDEKGFVKIKIDKVINPTTPTLEDLLKQYGLDDEEGEN